jgi:hypothetical protein
MGQIFLIIEMICRGMSQQNIKSFVTLQRVPQTPDAGIHLPLRILVRTVLIAHGTAKAQNADTLMYIDLILHTNAAIRRRNLIYGIVIPMNIQHGSFKKGGQKGEIERAEIAAGEDKINLRELLLTEIIP